MYTDNFFYKYFKNINCFRAMKTVDCDEKHYFVCSAPINKKIVCPKDHFFYKGQCIFQSHEMVVLKEAKSACAGKGGIVLPIKTKGMYSIITQYSFSTNAPDMYAGMNLTSDVDLYTDNQIYEEAVSFDFDGESMKFKDFPCVYLKKGIKYKARGISCTIPMGFYCLWTRKYSFFNILLPIDINKNKDINFLN